MPNWCSNTVTVEHADPAMIDKFEQAVRDGNLFQTFVPLSEWSWDDAVESWGTKWDISNGEVIDRLMPEAVCVGFETAWSPPCAFYDELMEQGFTVNGQYFESSFVVQYVNGEEVSFDIDPDDLSNIPDDLNEQWGITEMYEDWDEA
jgi:hypothetical protein